MRWDANLTKSITVYIIYDILPQFPKQIPSKNIQLLPLTLQNDSPPRKSKSLANSGIWSVTNPARATVPPIPLPWEAVADVAGLWEADALEQSWP